MKQKTHRLLSLLLCLVMVLGMLPAMSLTAFAAEPGISITDSTADSSGTGWSYVKSTKTLTLRNYNGGYIYASGMGTLNLVLEESNTITGDISTGTGDYCGICCDNVNLRISGSASDSLTINATANTSTRPTYGIYANDVTMSGGTVNINAGADTTQVYGVYAANTKLEITGGTLTANITGTSNGYGLYCKAGKLTVGSGAEVDVTVTNNGSSTMYGIYNEASDGGVTDNGDIALAGTVTVTRGSGTVYGIANNKTSSNTDGVISITGGSVTVTNAHYGIVAFTKGHAAAFEDVDISGGTVNVTSTTSDSLGIVSWNNGVTISGGTVTASTASKALWLADDSANKGLVKITGDAKVSLTSTDYKALVVQGDENTSSTRVHQINLTSGGSVTVKSTSSEVSYYAFPVQGYFNLGSSTKITEGSFSSNADGTNGNGGKLFQADSTTNRVVVAYSTLYTGAGAVSVNGHSFASDKLYYKNGGADTTNDSTDYNAHYDPATGVLELKDYNSGPIIIGGSNAYDVTIKLTGTNTVTTSAPKDVGGNVCVGINITNADNVTFIGDGTLTVNTNAVIGLTQVFGIWLDRSAAAAENLTFQSGEVTVNVTATDTAAQVFGVSTVNSTGGMGGPITVAEGAELNVTLSSASTGLANGLRSKGDITLNGKTAITLTYTGSGSPNASNWTSVSGFSGDNKLNVGANAAITVDMPNTYGLTNGMGPAYYAAKSDSQIGGDWTSATESEQYFENDSFLVTQSIKSGYGYADYKYEVITPLTFEDKADYDIPAGTKDDSYTAATALTATGGSGGYRYEFEGTKPSDLSINTENKLVYTRSSLCDATTATVKVTDKGGISKTITIDIGAVTEASPGTGTVPHIDNKTVPVGTNVTVQWPEGATAYQRFEGSNQVGSGDKSGYPDGMFIPAQSTAVTKTYKFNVSFPGGWVESNEFTVTWTDTPIPAATVDAVTVSGTTGTSIADTDVNITLTNDKFNAIATDTDVTSWFTNLPNGLEAKVKTAVNADDTTATITISGTPTVASDAVMQIKLPAANLVSSAELNVTANANAKFNISAPATYTVSFAANGGTGTMAAATGVSGDYVLPANGFTAPDGKQFKAWSVGGVEKAVGDKITVTANTTVTAVWEDIPVVTYTVTFDSNGGSAVTAQTIEAGQKATKPADPTKAGYDFKGWTLNGSAYDFNTAVNGNITLVATWEQQQVQPTVYTVTFDSDGGSAVTAQSIEAGQKATKPADPTKSGYDFKGWTLNGSAYDFNTAVNGNITLVATWEQQQVQPTVYTVTFDSDGGSAVTAQSIEAGQKATKPADPTKSGYDFKGWTLNGSAYDFNTAVNGNITLVATWEQQQVQPTVYTVTFDSDGGSAVTAQSIEAGQKATKPADPTKSGYDFKGWTLNGSAYDFNTAVNGNITLVATWEQQQVVPTTYTVSFDANGGSVTPASAETGADGKLTSLPTPTRSGSYSFNGWYTAASGGTKVTTSTIFNANTTIYAQWTYTGGSVVIIPDTDETDKSEPENPGTGAAVNPGTGAAAAGSSFGYPFVALAAVHAIYAGTKKDEE